MKKDYQRMVYYRRLYQKSNKPWRKNISKSPKNEKLVLPAIPAKGAQNEAENAENDNVEETKADEEKGKNETGKKTKNTKNEPRVQGSVNKKQQKGNDNQEKTGFHDALCDDFLGDDE